MKRFISVLIRTVVLVCFSFYMWIMSQVIYDDFYYPSQKIIDYDYIDVYTIFWFLALIINLVIAGISKKKHKVFFVGHLALSVFALVVFIRLLLTLGEL